MQAFFDAVGSAQERGPTKGGKRIVDDLVIEQSTADDQIARVLQPNYFWKNLNPFKVRTCS